jgi:peptidoglycan/LPS O-acetylase OafA/YrhL
MRDMQSTEGRVLPRRFYSLDALRGLAALGVVFSHWGHFFNRDAGTPPAAPEELPLYSIFQPLYTEGWRAVDLFFCLSGFVFYWLYSRRIQEGRVGLRQFAVLRFSRLYPLHLMTLLLVAAGQWFFLDRRGSSFIYPFSDGYHFALQLAFASSWGFERGFSFNGPVWSVSVEVLLYAAFFFMCKGGLTRGWHLLTLVVVGYAWMFFGSVAVGRGLASYFAGGITYLVFARLWRRGVSGPGLVGFALVTGVLWWVIPWNLRHEFLLRWQQGAMPHEAAWFGGKHPLGTVVILLSVHLYELALFPMTILTLALIEVSRGSLGRRAAVLGDISYSVYLWHFPLQLLFVAIIPVTLSGRSFYSSPLALALFFLVLLPVAWASYHFLERPSQEILRRWLSRSRSPLNVV